LIFLHDVLVYMASINYFLPYITLLLVHTYNNSSYVGIEVNEDCIGPTDRVILLPVNEMILLFQTSLVYFHFSNKSSKYYIIYLQVKIVYSKRITVDIDYPPWAFLHQNSGHSWRYYSIILYARYLIVYN